MTTVTEKSRVALLVDCENVPIAIMDYAIRVAEQFGNIVLRRAYGNKNLFEGKKSKWGKSLRSLAFSPCPHRNYTAGKNSADIALIMDAMEILLCKEADVFCLVTSDSDFTGLCIKVNERANRSCVIGLEKTPSVLRKASSNFFEWSNGMV